MKWKKMFGREYSVQYCEVAINSIGKRVRHVIKNSFMKNILIIPEHHNQIFYFERKEEKAFMDFIVKEFTADQQKFKRYRELFNKLGKEYVLFCRKVSELNLKKLNGSQLKKAYQEYQEKVINYSCIGPWIGHFLNDHWSKKGYQLVGQCDDKIKEALFRPQKKSTVLRMQEAAARINGDDKRIEDLWKKYRWISCLDIHNTPWSLEEVKEYVRNIKPVKNDRRMNFATAARKANLDQKNKAIFNLIRELGYIKDSRDDYRREGIFFIQSLFHEIANRMGISIKEVAYLTEREIIAFLDGNEVDITKGKKRKEGFLMYQKAGKIICLDHAINAELLKIGFVTEGIKIKEVQGTVACQGRAKGRVKIVRTVHDILKIEKGDILVAVTTHPDYVPAMQKAAAIVTDEGGMLSHAAIVSRELGVPCIVGTGNATTVLQHGQMVEVDATKGIVKVRQKA